MSSLAWEAMSRAERDAAYDNGAAVPGWPALSAERIAASAAWRAAHPGHLDLPYGPAPRTRWDLFPAQRASAPCFVFIHGGWWQFGAREENAVAAAGLAAHGWSVAVPGYTLAPGASLTRMADEIAGALDWLQVHGPSHGIAGPVLLGGWSAGALLAILGLDHPTARAALAFSGAYDLGPIRDTYIDAKLRLSADEVERLSPLRRPPGAKPLSLAVGGGELPALRRDARLLYERHRAVNPAGLLLELPDLDHFTIYHELTRPDGALVRELLRLASHLGLDGAPRGALLDGRDRDHGPRGSRPATDD